MKGLIMNPLQGGRSGFRMVLVKGPYIRVLPCISSSFWLLSVLLYKNVLKVGGMEA